MTERTGRCLCGAVSFKLVAEPLATHLCWCRDCQHLAPDYPQNQPDEMNACLAAAMPMANALTFCIPSQREGLGAGIAVAVAPEKPAKAGDQPHHLTQGWRDCRGFGAVDDDPGGLPFLGIEHHVTRQIRAVPTLGHEVEEKLRSSRCRPSRKPR